MKKILCAVLAGVAFFATLFAALRFWKWFKQTEYPNSLWEDNRNPVVCQLGDSALSIGIPVVILRFLAWLTPYFGAAATTTVLAWFGGLFWGIAFLILLSHWVWDYVSGD